MNAFRQADGSLVVRAPGAAWLWGALAATAAAVIVFVFHDSMRGRTDLSIPSHPGLERWIFPGILLLFALVMLAAWERSTYVFRPDERRVHWTRRGLFRERHGTVAFSGITSVLLVPSRQDGSATYQLALLTGGRRFVLGGTSSSDRVAHVRVGRAIADVLRVDHDVPFVDPEAAPRAPVGAPDGGA